MVDQRVDAPRGSRLSMVSQSVDPLDQNVRRPRVSVIVPTYDRRDLVVEAIRALAGQAFDYPFEVIVVVDGSRDGTAEALRQMTLPFALRVIEQANQGAAHARNRGAAEAAGEILLFLDDDMTADSRLLAEHDRSQRGGAEVVLGHMPLHPDSPSGFLSVGVEQWTEDRRRRLEQPGAPLTLHDLLTGQLSVSRAAFEQIGGFDLRFTHAGTFGNEDVDLGYRLLQSGFHCAFNPAAVSWQHYVVAPADILRRYRDVGCADVAFARKHPEGGVELFPLNSGGRFSRWVLRPLAAVRPAGTFPLEIARWLAATLARRAPHAPIAQRVFAYACSSQYWRGVYDAGGIPSHAGLRVLAYHAIADLTGMPVLEPYGVPPQEFARQLDRLQRLGFHFVTAEEALRSLEGLGGLPRRAVLLTFDDCYEDLLHAALPVLEQRGIPAVAFAVSGQLGGSNAWDQAIGAPMLPLLDGKGLQELARRGVEIGAHSRSHVALPPLSDSELHKEIAGSVADLKAAGLLPPRLFCYPYGEYDERVLAATARAGLRAAFTVEPGRTGRRSALHRLPRIEIHRNDVGLRFVLKVVGAQWLGPRRRLLMLRLRLTTRPDTAPLD
jgi:peptidoglycan/xylan/chitin deacetylase (PgdA/CDA1 family)/GT2 family glycosyltransferase